MKQRKRKAKENKHIKRPMGQIPIVDNKQSLIYYLYLEPSFSNFIIQFWIIIKNPK